MNSRLISMAIWAGAVLFAQGPRGPQSPAAVSSLDMAKLQTITGPAGAINMSYGTQYPSISVNKTLIKVAPLWYFLDQDFSIRIGDMLTVVTAPSTLSSDSYLYAIQITNNSTNAVIVLRDSAGFPLWSGPATRRPPRNGTGGIDSGSIATTAGIIDKLTSGAGIQHPSMLLKTADGKLLSIELGPERILLESDLELSAGQEVTVRYGIEDCTGEYVALSITNSTGTVVVLRKDNGSPNWN